MPPSARLPRAGQGFCAKGTWLAGNIEVMPCGTAPLRGFVRKARIPLHVQEGAASGRGIQIPFAQQKA